MVKSEVKKYMIETARRPTAVQVIKIRQLFRIAKLLYNLDLEFRQQNKSSIEYRWIDDKGDSKVVIVNKVFLAGMRKIRNNIYLALGEEGFTEKANIILQKYLTHYDIEIGHKFKQKSVADQTVT